MMPQRMEDVLWISFLVRCILDVRSNLNVLSMKPCLLIHTFERTDPFKNDFPDRVVRREKGSLFYSEYILGIYSRKVILGIPRDIYPSLWNGLFLKEDLMPQTSCSLLHFFSFSNLPSDFYFEGQCCPSSLIIIYRVTVFHPVFIEGLLASLNRCDYRDDRM